MHGPQNVEQGTAHDEISSFRRFGRSLTLPVNSDLSLALARQRYTPGCFVGGGGSVCRSTILR